MGLQPRNAVICVNPNIPTTYLDPTIPGNVFVQEQYANGLGKPISVRGPAGNSVVLGLGKWIELQPTPDGRLQIVGYSVPANAAAGNDVLAVNAPQLPSGGFVGQQSVITALVCPEATPDLTVIIKAWQPTVAGIYYEYAGTPSGGFNLSGSVPSSGNNLIALVFLNSDYATPSIAVSTARSTSDLPLGQADIQEALTAGLVANPGATSLAAIRLYGGQTQIVQADIVQDMRQLINNTQASGTGDVTGPATSTDHAAARWNGATGEVLADSGVLIDNSNNVQIPGILNTQSGKVRKVRAVTAAGAITVATTDDVVEVNKTSGAATVVNLPATPATGLSVEIRDGKGDAATHNITITPAAGNINGASTLVLSVNFAGALCTYDGTQWNAVIAETGSGGNVSGPGSSTDKAIATWNGTGGNTLQDNANTAVDTSGNLSAVSEKATGTAGAGFFEDVAQSASPSAPSATGWRAFATSVGAFAWRVKNGSDTFVRSFIGTLTGNHTYTLQDGDGTVAFTDQASQGYVRTGPAASADNLISAATTTIRALALKTTDNNTTNNLLEFLSSAAAVLAKIGATGLAQFAGIDSTPIGATTPAAVTATTLAADIIKQTSPASTTLSSDSFTFSKSYHVLTPETGVSDNLSTINGGTQGDILVLQAASSKIIAIQTGGGNIVLGTGVAEIITGDACYLLFYNGSKWVDFFPEALSANSIGSGTLAGIPIVTKDGSSFIIQNAATSSKQAEFDVSAITPSTTRIYAVRDESGIFQMQRLTTKGDLLTYSTTDVRLGIGADGTSFLADSGQATGNKWDIPEETLITYFGDGSDGALTVSSGTTTLTRDMYYSNVTISGTAKVVTAGYRMFISGTLDLTNAPANAITITPNAGGNGGNSGAGTGSAGAAGAALASNTIGGSAAGALGGAGVNVNTIGHIGGTGGTANPGNGGAPTAGGAGGVGSGTPGTAGASGPTGSVTNALPMHRLVVELIWGVSQLLGGGGGGGGGSGGGAAGGGATTSGGGGGGGGGGGIIAIFARTISRGGSTTASCINAIGGKGGNGGNAGGSGVGGGAGGGGAGGGGGWIYIVYGTLSGSTGTNAVDASGGTGGNGGNVGVAGNAAGVGADGASGGRITLVNLLTGVISESTGSTGTAHSGQTGGAGNSFQVSL